MPLGGGVSGGAAAGSAMEPAIGWAGPIRIKQIKPLSAAMPNKIETTMNGVMKCSICGFRARARVRFIFAVVVTNSVQSGEG